VITLTNALVFEETATQSVSFVGETLSVPSVPERFSTNGI